MLFIHKFISLDDNVINNILHCRMYCFHSDYSCSDTLRQDQLFFSLTHMLQTGRKVLSMVDVKLDTIHLCSTTEDDDTFYDHHHCERCSSSQQEQGYNCHCSLVSHSSGVAATASLKERRAYNITAQCRKPISHCHGTEYTHPAAEQRKQDNAA